MELQNGRKTFGNLMKYIKMATSFNFGEVMSVIIASVLLPFLPETPIQLLVEGLLYDFGQLTLPFDNVDKEYLQKVRKLCDEKDILLMFDEVQCGVGRTGNLFAYQTIGVVPDVATFAKGLAGGIPIGVMMAKDFVAQAFQPGDHASTFGGNSLATAAGLTVMKELFENGLLENVKRTGAYMTEQLKKLQQKHSCITDVRGIGFMQGIELSIPTADVINRCIEKGLLLVGAGHDVIRFVPALIAEERHIDAMIEILDKALTECE